MQYCKQCILGLLALLALSSCSEEITSIIGEKSQQPIQLSGQIDQENVTRANDYGFVGGDKMGIYIVDRVGGVAGQLGASDNRAQNVLFTYDDDNHSWSSPAAIYWRDEQTGIDIYGYYPGVNYIESPTSYAFEVQTDQSTEAQNGDLGGYEQSDLLWGKTTSEFTTSQIVLKYNHILAGVRVQLQKGDGITDTEWSKLKKIVLVENTVRKASVNLSTGATAVDGSDVSVVRMAQQSGDNYRAVVIPQTVAAGKQLLSITIDGKTYSHKLGKAMNYQGGKLHNFTMTVNKSADTGDYEVKVTDDGITPWTNDESSHKFTAMMYVTVHCPEIGKLKESISAAGYDYKTIKNLKVTGELTESDFKLLREEMPELKHLNLKEVSIKQVRGTFDYSWEENFMDDVIPTYGLSGNKTIHSLILPKKLKGLAQNALSWMQLMNSTLEIPEGVTFIGYEALRQNEYNGVTLLLPNSLDSIGVDAFDYCRYKCELRLPESLTYIGNQAFRGTDNFFGVFHLPSHLKHIGDNAFGEMGEQTFSGEVEIPQDLKKIPAGIVPGLTNRIALNVPQGVKTIGDNAFMRVRLSSLHLTNGLRQIGNYAFFMANMPFQLFLPEGLISVGSNSFAGCSIEGELVIPESCVSIGELAFAGNELTKVTFPNELTTIGNEAFGWNSRLCSVILPKYLERIGSNAFIGCGALQTIVSLNSVPPTVGEGAFEGVYFDKCILQVPEASIEAYRRANGWNQFQNITPYRELAVNITELNTLDKGMTREGIIRAEGEWEVSECPSWCEVTPMSGSDKSEVSITVNAQAKGSSLREGRIAFRLKNKDYTVYVPVRQQSYDYGEDETIILQKASAGAPKEVLLFIVGDGYNADDICSGLYLSDMREQMEYLFSCEPYKTYRNYFTVSTAIAVSPESGIPTFFGSPVDGKTRFNTEAWEGEFQGDDWRVWDYARQYGSGITYEREGETTIMVLLNSNLLAAKTYKENNGRSISYVGKSTDVYPYDQRDYVLREVGGAGFGKLAPEHISHFTFIRACECGICNARDEYQKGKALGWYTNVSLSGKMSDVPWSHLIFNEKYSKYVDIYEGAYRHARGVWRSEDQSVMSTYIPYYNTISRESIVKRIMQYAGKAYSFEEFVKNDKIEIPAL